MLDEIDRAVEQEATVDQHRIRHAARVAPFVAQARS